MTHNPRTASLRNPHRTPNPPLQLPDDGRSNYEKMMACDWYIAEDPTLDAANKRAGAVSRQFEHMYHTDQQEAQGLLNAVLGSLGEGTWIRPPLAMDYGFNLHVGKDVFINFGLTVLDCAEVRIGDNTQIGPNVQLLTAIHPILPAPRKAMLESADPIHIGKNVWIGGGAIILAGVKVGDNSVIGAGSVVTKDVPDNVVVAGNPARILRDIESE